MQVSSALGSGEKESILGNFQSLQSRSTMVNDLQMLLRGAALTWAGGASNLAYVYSSLITYDVVKGVCIPTDAVS